MFKKPVKVKTNTQIKASERKQFKDLLLKTFPNLTDDQLNEFLPKKEGINSLKVITSDNVILQVYTCQKRPIAFVYKGRMFPSVNFLWHFPDLVYSFTTHEQVTQYLFSGADLMLPGVITPQYEPKYGSVAEDEIVGINLTTNRAAVAVGVASQSSGAMTQSHGKGRCVIVYHFYGDNLCTIEGAPNLPVPRLGPPDWLTPKSYNEDFPQLGEKVKRQNSSEKLDENVPDVADENVPDITDENDIVTDAATEVENVTVEDMDELLRYCFLGAIKYSKTLTLPALTSNFFKLQVLPLCPSHKTLDLKKTSFKKLKPFLESMSQEGVITVKEIKKGVEAITAINKNHPIVSTFYIEPELRPKRDTNEADSLPGTDVVESYIITQNMVPLFERSGYKKGDIVRQAEVRKCIIEYIKENNQQDEGNARLVNPRETLAKICKTESSIHWEEAIEKVCNAMKNCYKVKSGMEEITAKGKIAPINITVSTRSGNKKVTLVDNLELFGIRVGDFAKECQHGVAASTSISRPPGKKTDQLLVQGNQVLFVYNTLTEKYKVPKKYVRGLEYAPKKK